MSVVTRGQQQIIIIIIVVVVVIIIINNNNDDVDNNDNGNGNSNDDDDKHKHMHIRHPKQHVSKQSCSNIQLSSKDDYKAVQWIESSKDGQKAVKMGRKQ